MSYSIAFFLSLLRQGHLVNLLLILWTVSSRDPAVSAYLASLGLQVHVQPRVLTWHQDLNLDPQAFVSVLNPTALLS